ncbi:MAG TPA: VOC family protein [Acidimicrobiales bacterium]|nr:VOC family protein [Acidimicrobiales bacterium]
MITGAHTLIYADDAEAARAFFRDVLDWPYVDAHDGWLIFKIGPSEFGAHPTAGPGGPRSGQHHEISLICDHIEATRAELAERGAQFSSGVEEAGFGHRMLVKVPGGGDLLVYEPRHPLAHSL